MGVNELRTGNLVKCKTSNDAGIYTVLGLDALHLKIYLSQPRNVWHSEDKIKGIKITEEWLLRFGLKDTGIAYEKETIEFNTFYVYQTSKGFSLGLNSTEIEVNFVHELQNVFYYMCREELKIINNDLA